MKKVFFCALLCLLALPALAQRNRIYNERIATLQVVAGKKWLSAPVVSIDEGTPIHISFDDKTHQYHRYVYQIEHCDANWEPSQGLFKSDYISGFADDLLIEHAEQSVNTNTLYTHYAFSIPNEQCRITMGGNYRVTVFDDDNNREPILTAHFMVVEPQVNIAAELTSNTDLDINNRHQQVSFQLSYPALRTTNPQNDFKTIVTQNNRWDNCRINTQPQWVADGKMAWQHNKVLVFDAGNEYRKFELLDVQRPSLGVESVNWHNNAYHAYLWQDMPRTAYVYDEDANGAFYIRNSDNWQNDVASDYIDVHFTLLCPRQQGEIYLNGMWTNDLFLPQYKMTYDETKHAYTATVNLKQGYYSYQYLLLAPDGTTSFLPSEGNFYQTENKYQVYVYFRARRERCDRLVGFREIQIK